MIARSDWPLSLLILFTSHTINYYTPNESLDVEYTNQQDVSQNK